MQRGLQRRGRELRQAGGFRGSRKQAVGEGCPTTVLRTGGWGPKMRHLVLYKLAGFFHADKTPWSDFFPGAMLVTRCQKNAVFEKKCALFDRKTPLFVIFRPKNALFSHSGGTSAHFRDFAKIAKFPNLARARVCTFPRSRAHTHFCVSIKKNIFSYHEKILKKIFSLVRVTRMNVARIKIIIYNFITEGPFRAPATRPRWCSQIGHSGACRKDGVRNYLINFTSSIHIVYLFWSRAAWT